MLNADFPSMFREAVELLKNSVDGQTSDMQNVPIMDTVAKPDTPQPPRPKAVAVIHANFTITASGKEPADGDIAIEEQIKSIQRFIKWHARQMAVGQSMLKRLIDERGPVPAPTPGA